MAGNKHDRSGASGGEASPLAAQLQQAWMHTQMPKTAKRSFISATSQQSKGSPDNQSSPHGSTVLSEQSLAFKSLSSIFPELAALPQEKKPMISSVFQDGEYPNQKSVDDSISTCPGYFDGTESFGDSLPNYTRASLAPRSFSANPAVHSSNSLEHLSVTPFQTSHSFSGNNISSPASSSEVGSSDYMASTPSEAETGSGISLGADFEPTDTRTLYSYLNNLMDDEPEDNKCMFVECSSYQVMAKELGDLIGDDFSTTNPSDHNQIREKDPGVEQWVEGLLSGPLPAEVPDWLKDQATIKSFTNYDSAAAAPQELHIFDAGNNNNDNGLWAAVANNGSTEMHQSTYNQDSVSYNEISEDNDALHLAHEPEPTMSQQLSNGHHIPPVDLNDLLLRCAQAIEQNDVSYASELIAELRQHSSPHGNGSQRNAHYFMEALVARMSGTGGKLYTALTNNRPSAPEMLKAFRLFVACCPIIRVSHIFSNLAIMNAIGNAKQVHIVDYGILYGVQWPCLIYHLSRCPGGPPQLRITGIDQPQPGFRPSERIQETGHRLARVAEHVGVPFEFRAIAEKWEAITPAHLLLRNNEVLAVNCVFRLRHLLDESVVAASPRDLVLNRIRSMNPKIFVQGVVNSACNGPFFLPRFRAGLNHMSTMFELIDASMPANDPDRVIVEQETFGRQILNIVACEGLERVERAETYKQWQSRTSRAGFTQLPIMETQRAKIRSLMRKYHRDYGIGEDGAWFLGGWKDKIIHAHTVWEPRPISP